MDELYAKCEDGAIFWRGSDATFTYMTPEHARLLALQFERPTEDRLPGWVDTRKAFAADLRQAISQWEQDNAE